MIPWASQPSHESSKSWTYWTSGTNIHELREISTPANRCKVAGEAMGGKTLAALLSQKTGCYKATWRNFDQILLSFDEVIVLFMCCHSLPLFCVLVACARSASSAAKNPCEHMFQNLGFSNSRGLESTEASHEPRNREDCAVCTVPCDVHVDGFLGQLYTLIGGVGICIEGWVTNTWILPAYTKWRKVQQWNTWTHKSRTQRGKWKDAVT